MPITAAIAGPPPEPTADAMLAVVRDYPGPILVDFDETLYLRNSTEDFLDSASPGLLAVLLLRLLEVLRPWRWTGGEPTRDVWRVRTIGTLMPWTWRTWRRRAPQLARSHANSPLVAALASSASDRWIVTIGFAAIVDPLARALGYPSSRLIASRHDHPEDRRRGKLALATAALGEDLVRRALVVTDSEDDRPLLERCANPLLTKWPDARYVHALSRVYMPGLYMSLVKRPGQRYIWVGILQEDFAFWVIGSIGLAALPLLHLLGLGFLLVSFWAIYERGYVDNDRVARDLEDAPRLSKTFGVVQVATPAIAPWIWALLCGAAGALLLRWPQAPSAQDFLRWSGVLVATAVGFWVYNRVDKNSRIWLFTGLQAARAMAFMVLVPVPLACSLAVGAHVIARWVPYYTYRVAGQDWPEAPFFLSRLSFYVLLWLIVGLSQNFEGLLNWTALALFGWNLLRARKDLRAALAAFGWLPKQGRRGA